ncbi:type III secretion system outer membrane ring subunit SctC [Burkholderia pyrrocinia]
MMNAYAVKRYAVATAVLLVFAGMARAEVADPPVASAPAAASAIASDEATERAVGSSLESEAASSGEPSRDNDHHFVANDASISVLLNALSGRLHKPMVASDKVRRKRLTGEFDLTKPRAMLRQLGESMSLLWYDDGSSVYVYDNSEIKNAVISMQHATVRRLRDFIHETRLYDARFPIRGDDLGGTFYVTGAPIYVNLVTAAARYLDELTESGDADKQIVKVVQLHNSFVGDRQYMLRDKQMNIAGMASVLARIFSSNQRTAPVVDHAREQVGATMPPAAQPTMPFSLSDALPKAPGASDGASAAGLAPSVPAPSGAIAIPASYGVRAVAYPDTNSIILTGTLEKVQDMEALIRSLDVEKRQIELSLWIIDIKKSRLDELGVDWKASLDVPGLSVGLNSPANNGNMTTLDGGKFLASVAALSQDGDATVVSRPVVLTQENVPAIFDSNQTFYAKLIGERSVQLDHVTYGTLVSVLPRLSADASEVEMVVDVEDGNTDGATKDGQIVTDNNTMPLVNRTEINTVARVPREMSLLIGGNTRDDVNRSEYRVPGLASIPLVGNLFRHHTDQHEQVVRVFLIQPKLLRSSATWQDGQQWESGDVDENQTLRSTIKLLQPYVDNQQ